ncbi:MAG: response regulator [Desulfobulbaceae bacterium]|nr:response regulator [Desulfobulbaceae bacterium]HIJ77903.1 response regulator [Deltaproteobacteria bacterium]
MVKPKVKILIVDDRPENIHAMKVVLQPLTEAQIFTAQSGNAALSLMTEHDFAVVLMDVQMPEMDGFETADLMQHHQATRNVPIIFVTAINKDEEHVFKGYESGAVDYIFKPFNPDILLSKVQVFINLYSQRMLCEQMQKEIHKMKNIEALGILAGGIAHDFNNLMTTIFSNIELARMKSFPGSEVYARLTDSLKATDKVKELTRQLLTFSKGGNPNKEEVDLVDLLSETSSLLLKATDIKTKIECPSRPRPIMVDKSQLAQVFTNIIENAREAMPGDGHLTISACELTLKNDDTLPLTDNGEYLKITIADDGPGMEETVLAHIFDPYFSTKDKSSVKGQGLGLTIAHSIIKKHKGYIQAESRPGQGTTFTIYLPMQPEKESSPQEEAAQIPSPSNEPKSKRILVVDDDTMVATMVCEMLECLGYKAETTKSGREALQLYAEAMAADNRFGGVILDLTLPGEDSGEKVLTKLLEIDPRAKAIVSSGHSESPVMINYPDYGFVGAINKPFRLADLDEKLKKVL